MSRDEKLLRYYHRRVERGNRVLAQTPEGERARVDFANGYWHERVILQRLLERAGVPICHGAVDCVQSPTTTCVTAQHSACPSHIYSCYLCVALDDEQKP